MLWNFSSRRCRPFRRMKRSSPFVVMKPSSLKLPLVFHDVKTCACEKSWWHFGVAVAGRFLSNRQTSCNNSKNSLTCPRPPVFTTRRKSVLFQRVPNCTVAMLNPCVCYFCLIYCDSGLKVESSVPRNDNKPVRVLLNSTENDRIFFLYFRFLAIQKKSLKKIIRFW